MTNFKRAATIVQAWKWERNAAEASESTSKVDWVDQAFNDNRLQYTGTGLAVSLGDGSRVTISNGDYVIRAPDGTLSVCPADSFQQLFAATEEPFVEVPRVVHQPEAQDFADPDLSQGESHDSESKKID